MGELESSRFRILAQSVRGNRWLLGYCLVLIFDSLGVVVEGGLAGWSFSDFSTTSLVSIAAYGAAVLLPRRVERIANVQGVCVLAACLAAAGVLVGACQMQGWVSFPLQIRFLAGAAVALFQLLFTLRFFAQFAKLPLTDVVSLLAVCHVASPLASLVLGTAANLPAIFAVLAVLPFAVLFCALRISADARPADATVADPAVSRDLAVLAKSLVRPLVLLLGVLAVVAVERSFLPAEWVYASYAGPVLGSLLVVAVMGFGGKVVKFRLLYQSSLLFLIAGLWCIAVGTVSAIVVAAVMANAGYVLFTIFLDGLLCDACRRFDLHPYRVFGLMNVGIQVGYGVGAIAGGRLILGDDFATALWMFTIACLLVIVFLVFMTDRDYRSSWGTAELEEGRPSIVDFYGSLSETCSAVAQQYGLSRREEEVLVLLAQRKTSSEIEAELFISNSTVKSHSKSIYKKLGIHKREELLELVGHPSVAK